MRILYTPTSHPFIERLVGTIQSDYLSRLLFWNAGNLQRKMASFAHYYNQHRVHQSLDGQTSAHDDQSKHNLAFHSRWTAYPL
jgi:putative transposase